MTFEECCTECIQNEELIEQFCRLNNIKRPDRLSPVEIIVDQSCGYNAKEEFIKKFADFIFYYIWVPLEDKELAEAKQ
ncbi:hypothetical protein [Lacrimispora sp.]|uniref:hypothetical protein n=1 Tax=Lacrimispora sp. TaxID=2719234 RepID=UPI0028A5E154|nr:hypothetical protein [Lacrimispora sp.]